MKYTDIPHKLWNEMRDEKTVQFDSHEEFERGKTH
jgi:hypothetical protein